MGMKIGSHEQSLWSLLGVTPDSSKNTIDRTYKRLRNTVATKDLKELQFAWKLLRDPFFSLSYSRYRTTESVIEAGFFNDGLDPEDYSEDVKNPFWLTTPFHKILDNISNFSQKEKNKPLVVLVSTGAFAPIHAGHVKMMEIAKKEIENRGKIVLGGYISPSHDGYLAEKH